MRLSETLINNKIIYSTKHITEYNQDVKKGKNIYRSNTGYEGKQQEYNRNPWQDNFNNVIAVQQTHSNHQNNESEEHCSLNC